MEWYQEPDTPTQPGGWRWISSTSTWERPIVDARIILHCRATMAMTAMIVVAEQYITMLRSAGNAGTHRGAPTIMALALSGEDMTLLMATHDPAAATFATAVYYSNPK